MSALHRSDGLVTVELQRMERPSQVKINNLWTVRVVVHAETPTPFI
jgi:hypothetical protein